MYISVSDLLATSLCSSKLDESISDTDSIYDQIDLKDYLLRKLLRYGMSIKGRGVIPSPARLNHKLNLLWSEYKNPIKVNMNFMIGIKNNLIQISDFLSGYDQVLAVGYIASKGFSLPPSVMIRHEIDGLLFNQETNCLTIVTSYNLKERPLMNSFQAILNSNASYHLVQEDFMKKVSSTRVITFKGSSCTFNACRVLSKEHTYGLLKELALQRTSKILTARPDVTVCRYCIKNLSCPFSIK